MFSYAQVNWPTADVIASQVVVVVHCGHTCNAKQQQP